MEQNKAKRELERQSPCHRRPLHRWRCGDLLTIRRACMTLPTHAKRTNSETIKPRQGAQNIWQIIKLKMA